MPDTQARSGSPTLSVSSTPTLIDNPVTIRLSGLPPQQSVTVQARMQDHFDRWWQAHATFLVDATGQVEVGAKAPVAGTYAEPDPMGLFWSMSLETPGGPPTPFRTLAPVTVTVTAEVEGQIVAEATAERLLVAPGVIRQEVREAGLAGIFFRPPDPGSHPPLLVLGGSEGGLFAESRAALLASHGYAALALAYFAFEHLPAHLHNIPLEYFETAMHWVQAQPGVSGDQLAVYGASRGGELALLLGATFPHVRAVVAIVPSGIMHGSVGVLGQPSWSHRGLPLPFLFPADALQRHEQVMSQEPVALTPWFLQNLEDQAAVERATIPVERINGPVLLISAEDDQMWPSSLFADLVVERLIAHSRPYPVQHLRYPGAGHQAFRPPYAPVAPAISRHPIANKLMTVGGTGPANAAAMVDSWQQTLGFLDEHLRSQH